MKKPLSKKIWTLGAPLAIAPLALAASCTDTVASLTTEQIETNAALENSKNIIEVEYQEKLIKAINPGFDKTSYTTIFNSTLRNGTATVTLKDLVKYFVNQQIFDNRDYLKTYGQALLKVAQDKLIFAASGLAPVADAKGNYSKVTYADVNRYHLLDEVPTSGVAWISEPAQSALFDELVQQMLKSNINDVKNQIYRFIIGYNYLDLSKAEWDGVYHKNNSDKTFREYTSTDVEIDEETFVLTKEVIKNKAFFTWTATLTEEESKAYINLKAQTLAQVDTLMMRTAAVSNRLPLSYSSLNKVVPQHLSATLASSAAGDDVMKLSELASYQGLQKRVGAGYKSLGFGSSEMRAVSSNEKYRDAYNGYVFDNELRRTNIELFASGAKIVSLTRIQGIMPQYANAKFNVRQFDRGALKSAMYFLNSTDIYDEALTYYTNRTDAVKLKIADSYLRKLAIDKFGFSFIESE